MIDPSERADLVGWYGAFAAEAALGGSAVYERLGLGIASDPELCERLLRLPTAKRQPNLLLAASRVVCGLADDYGDFRERTLAGWDAVSALMLTRSTQTNEPGRCASLVPALVRLPQPIALLEVGASAGLCLYPDRYSYDYGVGVLGGAGPVLRCRLSGTEPPNTLPAVVWRAGLDLNPLSPLDPADVAWLEALVWPGRDDRLARLRGALDVARADPATVVRGDLRTDLVRLAGQAPRDATLVVLHSAVLAYVDPPAVRGFVDAVQSVGAVWLSNEGPDAVSEVVHVPDEPATSNAFLLAQDGVPLAWASPHGDWLEWITT